MAQSNRYFFFLSEYRLLICKSCKHAVCLSQIRTHLRGKHHELGPKETAAALADIQQKWVDLINNAYELVVPTCVDRPITQLPLYKDGLLCTLEPKQCYYICRNPGALKKHWREVHRWSLSTSGGSGKQKEERVQARLQIGRKEVYCQRFFTHNHGSQFF